MLVEKGVRLAEWQAGVGYPCCRALRWPRPCSEEVYCRTAFVSEVCLGVHVKLCEIAFR